MLNSGFQIPGALAQAPSAARDAGVWSPKARSLEADARAGPRSLQKWAAPLKADLADILVALAQSGVSPGPRATSGTSSGSSTTAGMCLILNAGGRPASTTERPENVMTLFTQATPIMSNSIRRCPCGLAALNCVRVLTRILPFCSRNTMSLVRSSAGVLMPTDEEAAEPLARLVVHATLRYSYPGSP